MALGYFEPSTNAPQHLAVLQGQQLAVARANRVLGLALTKDSKYRKARDKAAKYRDKYLKCKARRKAKGKQAWPVDTGSAISGNCKHDYERWQHWEEKAADRARDLKGKLEKKGKLDPQMAADLNEAMVAPSNKAQAEYQADKKNWENEQNLAMKKKLAAQHSGGSGGSGGSAAPEYPEPALENYSAEASVDYSIPIAIGGAVLLLAGGAFLISRRKKKPASAAAAPKRDVIDATEVR